MLLTMTTSPPPNALAAAVRDARLAKGWSKEEAARHAGITSITWKRVEDGLPVQDHKLNQIAGALGWAPGEAFRLKSLPVVAVAEDEPLVRRASATDVPDLVWTDDAIEVEIGVVREHLEKLERMVRERRERSLGSTDGKA